MAANKERILVVDDEAVVRKLLCKKLSAEGYVCLTYLTTGPQLVIYEKRPLRP